MKGWTKEMVRTTVETNYPFCNGVTKDEAIQLAHDLLCELKQTRKETAEKFAERLISEFKEEDFWCDFVAWTIDKICKKITEGKV